ncbi:YbaB/EbfC family nucleoid-associated protein [Streptomyces flaveolus]|uniref:YbaB/EbfC family nucleoid-associated protein n=1 Tax=Streptomyces flaveolus TaxID=67297 RepID=UPI0033B61B79
MEESFRREMQDALAEFTKQHEALRKARTDIAALSATVRSKDRSVEVTVGPQGEVTALRFLGNRHQTMTAQKLAASVLEAISQARTQVGEQATKLFESIAGLGSGVTNDGFDGLGLDRLLEPTWVEDLGVKGNGGTRG